MPAMKYDKPAKGLIRDMVREWDLKPGQVFTAARAVEWFAKKYPLLQPTGIKANLALLSTNDKNRLHHYSMTRDDDLLFKVASSQYRLYEPGKDPAPIHELVEGDVAKQEEITAEEVADADDGFRGEPLPGSSEFVLEKDLQSYLIKNLSTIEAGLVPFNEQELSSIEAPAGNGRRIDILAKDSSGAIVVIELKVSRGYDRVVGQLLRYMNWVRMEVAEAGQRVRGIIVCRTMSEDLRLACASIKDVQLFEYTLSVSVSKVAAYELPEGS